MPQCPECGIEPRQRNERVVMKQKFQSQLAQKQVAYTSAQQTLKELRTTILESASSNPMEDLSRTSQMMSRGITETQNLQKEAAGQAGAAPIALPVFTPYFQSRFGGGKPAAAGAITGGSQQGSARAGGGDRQAELTGKDFRKAADLSLRQLLTIDDWPAGAPEAPGLASDAQAQQAQAQQQKADSNVRMRHMSSYRDSRRGLNT